MDCSIVKLYKLLVDYSFLVPRFLLPNRVHLSARVHVLYVVSFQMWLNYVVLSDITRDRGTETF
jgi:hypothetical protein